MSGLAVVALVVVVGRNLPVVVGIDGPHVVEVIVSEVKVLETLLLVDTVEVFLPGDLGLGLRVKVDPDEAVDVNANVDGE